jgi:hypothetical protein
VDNQESAVCVIMTDIVQRATIDAGKATGNQDRAGLETGVIIMSKKNKNKEATKVTTKEVKPFSGELKPYALGIDLQLYFMPVKKIFKHYASKGQVKDRKDNDKHRIFVNNEAKVLLVAHLDTVQKPEYNGFEERKFTKKKVVNASGLDDRLGWYTICKLIGSCGVKADVLLTDHEERGASTAEFHKLFKRYNWVAELDRRGDDVVTYNMTSPDFDEQLKKHFKRVGNGSFSDICLFKKYHKVCCVNVGIGYYKAHAKDSYVDIEEHDKQIERFLEFYKENYNRRFNREALPVKAQQWQRQNWNNYGCGYGYGYGYQQRQLTTKHSIKTKHGAVKTKYDWNAKKEDAKIEPEKLDNMACDYCGFDMAEVVHGKVICSDCLEYAIEQSSLEQLRYYKRYV